jgi:MFS family permease
MSIFFTVHYVALAVLPPVAGWLRDTAGTRWSVVFAGALWLSILASLAAFRLIQRRFGAPPQALPAEK